MLRDRFNPGDESIPAAWLNGVTERLWGSAGQPSTGGGSIQIVADRNGIHITEQPIIRFELVELTDTIQSKNIGKQAKRFRYTPGASDPWSDSGESLKTCADAMQSLYLAGERHMVYSHPGSDQRIPIPGVQFHLGKITSQPGGVGQAYGVEVWKVTSTNTPPASQTIADSTFSVYAYQWSNQNVPNGGSRKMRER